MNSIKRSNILVLLLFVAIAVFSLLSSCSSCSKSGQLAQSKAYQKQHTHAERVVIINIDHVDQKTALTRYKVRRIDFNNCVDFRFLDSGYLISDTLIVHYNDNEFRF